MIDIYETWIRDFRIDGFRMDTMKHVDDPFWQKFAPAIQSYAASQGIPDFYMFGEVAEDFSRPITSHYMVHDAVQGVLDFPFQTAATHFAAGSAPTDELRDFFVDDDWYTDGDSNVYNLPTFLGNHDRGRIGMFVRNANPGAGEAELLKRDELAHELMYFSRGDPVVYYGDEQGFTGAGGDQDARQDMFPSQDLQYNNLSDPIPGDDGAGNNDDIGSNATPMNDNFDPSHPLYRRLAELAAITRENPALRDGAEQVRYSTSSAGIYAFSRIDRDSRYEYVVALNNSEQAASASIPTFVPDSKWERIYGEAPGGCERRRRAARRLGRAALDRRLPLEEAHSAQPRGTAGGARRACRRARPARGRRGRRRQLVLRGHVPRQGGQRRLAGHRHRRQCAVSRPPGRVRHRAGDDVQYRAVVLDNAGHTRSSAVARPRSRRPRSRSRRRTKASACAAPSRSGRPRRPSTPTMS